MATSHHKQTGLSSQVTGGVHWNVAIWILLVILIVYDTCIVLCPGGLLRMLVEESEECSDAIPALVYTSAVYFAEDEDGGPKRRVYNDPDLREGAAEEEDQSHSDEDEQPSSEEEGKRKQFRG
jgi:presenilin 1